MFRPSAATRANRLHETTPERMRFPQSETNRSTASDDRATARSVDRAIDCWCHGVAHLLSALGPEEALVLMSRTVVDLVDRNAATPVVPQAPHSI